MYTIKGAAQRVGIAPSTLRAWERRYGVVAPGRTDGGYRVYSEDDVQVLAVMARLVDEGRPPSLAAQEALRQRGGTPPSDGSEAVIDRAGAPEHVPQPDGLVDAAAALDERRLSVALDQMFARGSFEAVVDRSLIPALDALGEAWASGQVSVAGEHLVANAVMRRLAAGYEAASSLTEGSRILLGMAPGRRHELGLFAFAVAARRQGLVTDYLGADLPMTDWLAAMDAPDVAAVVLAIPTSADVAPAAAVIGALRERRPDLLIAVGGGYQDQAPEEAVRLGHQIGSAASALAALIAAGR